MARGWRRRHLGWGAGVFFAAATALPGVSAAQTDQSRPIQVTVNHAAAISLRQNPGVVLIANPDIADIVNDRSNLIFVLGRKPGATNLLVYDTSGQPLLNREIEVVPDSNTTVTITRETDKTTYFCEPNCVLYEHEAVVQTNPTALNTGGGLPAQGGGGGIPLTMPAPPAPSPSSPPAGQNPGGAKSSP